MPLPRGYPCRLGESIPRRLPSGSRAFAPVRSAILLRELRLGEPVLGSLVGWRAPRRPAVRSVDLAAEVESTLPAGCGVSRRRSLDTHSHGPGVSALDALVRGRRLVSNFLTGLLASIGL